MQLIDATSGALRGSA